MGNITSDLNKIGFRKERNNASASYIARYTDSYRVGYGGVQATPVAIPATDCLGWDKPDGEMDIPEPLRSKEELNVIGDGPKTADIVEMGYEVVEQAITVNAQTGIWLYYALGGYSCDGTNLSSPLTDTVASVSGKTVTLTDPKSATANLHRGRLLVITNGDYEGWVFVITANEAASTEALVLTVNTVPPQALDATIAAATCKIVEAPFTHTISEPTTTATQVASNSQVYLPTFITHFEQSDGTNIEYRDLIGCLVKSLKITIEKGAKVMYEVTIMVPKSMVGLNQTTYPTYALCGDTRAALSYPTDEIFGWYDFNLAGSSFTYATNAIFGSTQNWFNELGKLEITIEHDITIEPIQGDPYAYKMLIGKLDYTVLTTYYPNSNEIQEAEGGASTYRVLKSLKRMKLSEYDGNVAMVVKLARSATDYVQLTFSSLYVSAYPDKLTTIEEKQVSIDVELKNAPAKGSVTAGSLAVVVVDDRNPAYYGDT